MHQAARFSGMIFLSLLLAVMVAGCKKEQHVLKFSHQFHIEMELTCDTCHTFEDGKMTMPGHEQCEGCHGEQIEAEMSADDDACGHCHSFKEEEIVLPEDKATGPSLFMHTEALMEAVACASCHFEIVETEGLATPKIGPDDRREIMVSSHSLGMDCGACHENMSPDVKPPSHLAGGWDKRHGMEARLGGEETCATCHNPVSTCEACHKTEMPDGHTNFFRQQSHGIEASVNRDKCMTCHEVDSCERCHSTNAPRSHRAGWSYPNNRHCYNCHATAGASSGCFVCHRGGLRGSHPSAPVPPPSTYHRPQASCLACHGPNAGSGPPPLPRPELIRRLNPARHAVTSEDLCSGCHPL